MKKAGTTIVADGLWMSSRGQFLFTSPEDGSVKLRDGEGHFTTVAQGKALRWPDSMAEGPDGAIYVTASHIPGQPHVQGRRAGRSTDRLVQVRSAPLSAADATRDLTRSRWAV